MSTAYTFDTRAGTEARTTRPRTDRQATLDRLQSIANTMDARFRIPIFNVRLGFDTLIGLVPGIGDAVALLPGLYILYEARRIGAPAHLLARMGLNSGIDLAIGTIPIVGDLFDIGFKSNRRNVRLLREHFQCR
ncbi:DUF4112 domain-containing protein [Pseudoruegeria sp. HB172150]|uniref:DUF4112 domain-containing protein n=1 Tax=Pseudoruegeria sp. HB172150 TaxID=2721164 RepID=UPI001551CE7F|nr:DUF4112 domain-containing protein [Pseudoruegeria sp. HB172150]